MQTLAKPPVLRTLATRLLAQLRLQLQVLLAQRRCAYKTVGFVSNTAGCYAYKSFAFVSLRFAYKPCGFVCKRPRTNPTLTKPKVLYACSAKLSSRRFASTAKLCSRLRTNPTPCTAVGCAAVGCAAACAQKLRFCAQGVCKAVGCATARFANQGQQHTVLDAEQGKAKAE